MNLFHKKRASIVLIIDLESQSFLSIFKDKHNYNIPGGKCFIDETDIDCAIREVQEETGLYLDEKHLDLIMSEKCEDYIVSTYITYLFYGTISSEEEHEIEFVPFENLLINKNFHWITYHKKLLNLIKIKNKNDL
jgi:8-oxo-dGTP pyrophosphatase MutT (NUDIX family)